MKWSVVVLTALLGCVALCSSSGVRAENGGSGQSDSWDFLMLVQQWAPGVCESASSNQHCTIPSYVRYWTIHGFWPNNNDGSYPYNCKGAEPFNMKRLFPIQDALTAFWPTLYKTGSMESFWQHEYEKHGTCASSDALMGNELKYFNATLTLRRSLDLAAALKKANISPSSDSPYTVTSISAAVQQATGGTPVVQCTRGRGSQVLSSLALCVAADFSVLNCPSNIITKEGCHSDEIYYLPF